MLQGIRRLKGDVQGTGALDVLNSAHGYFGGFHPLQLFLNPAK
jgi:hypothetical protein